GSSNATAVLEPSLSGLPSLRRAGAHRCTRTTSRRRAGTVCSRVRAGLRYARRHGMTAKHQRNFRARFPVGFSTMAQGLIHGLAVLSLIVIVWLNILIWPVGFLGY